MASSHQSFIEAINRNLEMLEISVETEIMTGNTFVVFAGKYAEPVIFMDLLRPQNAICEAIDRLRSRLAGAYAL